MEIGLIGLGKMGGNMAQRLRNGGHTVVGYDRSPDSKRDVTSLSELVQKLSAPRVVWVMVPAGHPTDETIVELGTLLSEGDLIVDGGNSHYTEDIRHAEMLKANKVKFVDCGVSGGVWGLQNGYGLMSGGAPEDVAMVQPALDTLKPEVGGYVRAGGVGAGHFVKMVHNGIEYGIMQAYSEGYELMTASPIVENVTETMRSWQNGTVIRSWLLDLAVDALDQDPGLSKIRGFAADSGEGRWTVEAAIDNAVPLPVITASLFARFASRQEDSPAMKMVAALRNQFGGHAVEAAPSTAAEAQAQSASGVGSHDSVASTTAG